MCADTSLAGQGISERNKPLRMKRAVRSRSTFPSDISGVQVALLDEQEVSNGNADCDQEACRTFGVDPMNDR